MSIELPFDPFPLFPGSHQQTIIASFLSIQKEPFSKTKLVELEDKDFLALEVTTPRKWKPTDPTVIMIHGLCGSHRSPYLIRMTRKLKSAGLRSIRLNLRGCGSGRGLARQIYHSGRSADVYEALKKLKEETPDSPFILVGFSLGGNIVLKLGGELNSSGKDILSLIISVSPPSDLHRSIELIGSVENRFYERYFTKLLRADVYYRHRKFPDLPKIDLPKRMSCYEFDELYTAPQCGFDSAMDYYTKCSSKGLVSEIRVPCKVLLAEDDPLICSTSLDEYTLPENVEIYKTKKGGHLGYLGSPRRGFHWMDRVLLDWISEEFS